jgi:hypothetical protein
MNPRPILFALLLGLAACGPSAQVPRPQAPRDRFRADTQAVAEFLASTEGKWSGTGDAMGEALRVEARIELVDVDLWKQSRGSCAGTLCTVTERYFHLLGDHLLVGSREDGTDAAPVRVLEAGSDHLRWIEEIHPSGHRIEAIYELTLVSSSLQESYESRDNDVVVTRFEARMSR